MINLPPDTLALLDYKLRTRGIARAADEQEWQPGPWPVYVDDKIDHYERGWYAPVYGPTGARIVNTVKAKDVLAWKNADSSATPHDSWLSYLAGHKPMMLPRSGILNAVRDAKGYAVMCEGKADTLSLLSAKSIPNVIGVFGCSFVPADLLNQLLSWNVRALMVYVHPDEAGRKMAQKVCDLLGKTNQIVSHFYQLPIGDNGEKRDLNVLWQLARFSRDDFKDALTALPEVEFVPQPVKVWQPRSYVQYDLALDAVRAYGAKVASAILSDLSKVAAARNDALNCASFKIGTYVAAGALDPLIENELVNIGVSIGLGQSEVVSTVRSGLTAGLTSPADLSKLKPSKQPTKSVTNAPKKGNMGIVSKPSSKRVQQHPVTQEKAIVANPSADIFVDQDTATGIALANGYVKPRLSRSERMAQL